ncbi:WhiB family transcriptional regulator [Bifidobacterium bombi]|uniref:Transcription factor WhiB n=1 Tax=Bifidobacterium bombi DSM 19703 TaxID=1341695 RepID=A0A086BNQ2_9BIFI|nr:WhiB family transcriptional regulator [Bifidobacterium bombi]KFF30566.1 transcription factor WhiB [Bifidobacterium bombi DSM 19703]
MTSSGANFKSAVGKRLNARGGTAQLCRSFPQPFADAMWGLDEEIDSTSEGQVLQRAGAAVCGVCPLRINCMAQAIARRDRYGLSGGPRMDDAQAGRQTRG